jgi:hypothetical protein
MSKRSWIFAAAALVSASVLAQDKPAERVKRPGTPLRVQIVISRYQVEKKVSSLPYTLLVTADEKPTAGPTGHGGTVVRFGLMMPLQTMANNAPTVAYRDVGTTLDCSAETQDDGRFKVSLQVEQLAAFGSDFQRKAIAGTSALASVPLLSMFKSSNVMVLRDGQTVPWVAATDPTNGETLKIDVSLSVIK